MKNMIASPLDRCILLVTYLFSRTGTSLLLGILAVGIGSSRSSADLLNKYTNDPSTWVNGAFPQGGGSTNITATSSGVSAPAAYGPFNAVEGNFATGDSNWPYDIGGDLQPSGFYGMTPDPDPDVMTFMTDGNAFGIAPPNQTWLAFSFNDGPHTFDQIRMWTQNERNQSVRGINEFYVYHSNDATIPAITAGATVGSGGAPGAGWTVDTLDLGTGLGPGGKAVSQAPESGDYDGETIELGDFTAQHVLFLVASNHGGDYTGMHEVQFFVPEPGSIGLLLIGLLGLAWRRRS